MATLESAFSFIKRKWLTILIVVIVVVFIGVTIVGSKEERDRETYVVVRQDVKESVLLSGTVDAISNVDLSFGISGKVENVSATQGEVVEVGRVLASLDLDVLRADLLQARGNVQSAEAKISAAEAGVKKAEANLALVQAQNRGDSTTLESAIEKLENTKAEQEVLVGNARAALLNNDLQVYPDVITSTLPTFTLTGSYSGSEQGAYNLRIKQSSQSSVGYAINYSGIESGEVNFVGFDIPQALGTKGLFVTFPSTGEGLNYLNSTWIVPIPNNRSATYQTKLNAYTSAQSAATTAITNAENELEKLQAEEQSDSVGLTTAEEKQAEAAVEEARASLAQAKSDLLQAEANLARTNAQLGDGVITAPFTGTIARVDYEVGESVTSGQSGITLISDGAYELVMSVSEIDISKITIGNTARLTLDVFGNDVAWDGEVTVIELIETELDGVPVYETHIEVKNPDSRMRVGMNARAEIVARVQNDVLAIPFSYITKRGNEQVVTLQTSEDAQEERRVEIGLRGTNNFIEIISGLEEGDIIVRPESE